LALVPICDASALADGGEKHLEIEDRFGDVRHHTCRTGVVRSGMAQFRVS